MPPSGSVLLMPGAGDANPYGRRTTNPYCSSLQDEQGPLSALPMVPIWNLSNPISSSSSVNLNATELRFLLIAIWLMFHLIPLDLILSTYFGVLIVWESFRLLLLFVNVVFRYVRTIRFRVAKILIQRLLFEGSAMRVRMLMRFNVLAGRAKMHHQKFNKNWKNQEPPNVDWSDNGWSCGWPVRVDSKANKNGEKNYKIMERLTLAWGKHKNGKNQLQKPAKHGEKLETKNRCRCVRECRFGGSFFLLWKGKSSSCSSSRT
jgi:hypothetical protein